MIPAEAIEAAAECLPHSDDCEVRPERYCTCWQPRINIMRAALEAAAPHMVRLVTTPEELDALWLGSVVLSQGVAYQKYEADGWAAEGRWYDSGQVELPTKVLHDPQTGAAS